MHTVSKVFIAIFFLVGAVVVLGIIFDFIAVEKPVAELPVQRPFDIAEDSAISKIVASDIRKSFAKKRESATAEIIEVHPTKVVADVELIDFNALDALDLTTSKRLPLKKERRVIAVDDKTSIVQILYDGDAEGTLRDISINDLQEGNIVEILPREPWNANQRIIADEIVKEVEKNIGSDY